MRVFIGCSTAGQSPEIYVSQANMKQACGVGTRYITKGPTNIRQHTHNDIKSTVLNMWTCNVLATFCIEWFGIRTDMCKTCRLELLYKSQVCVYICRCVCVLCKCQSMILGNHAITVIIIIRQVFMIVEEFLYLIYYTCQWLVLIKEQQEPYQYRAYQFLYPWHTKKLYHHNCSTSMLLYTPKSVLLFLYCGQLKQMFTHSLNQRL